MNKKIQREKKSFLFSKYFRYLSAYFKYLQKKSRKHRLLMQRIQLSVLYFFAIVTLTYTITQTLGYFPNLLLKIFPFAKSILNMPLLKFLSTPEKTIMLYAFALEYVIINPRFDFSVIFKFNVLLVFLLEMLENLLISYWDLFYIRDIDVIPRNLVNIPKTEAVAFCTALYIFFFTMYIYCYIKSLQRKFPIFPGILQKIVDSVAFWFRLKRIPPKKKKKKDNNE